ncbi:MAG: Hvo_1808 family surface protein [Halodesulfurarchaeum sp.]
MSRRFGVVILVAVVALAGCSSISVPEASPTEVTPAPTPTTGPTPATPSPSATPAPSTTTSVMVDTRSDPSADRLGWESGYWYNETVTVTRDDGLNDSELDAVVARSMARVEQIRNLEFNQHVPVEVISRETFKNRTLSRNDDLTSAQRLHQNVKFEALFMLGENESAIAQREQNTAANVLGYYSPSNDSIVIVSQNTDSPQLNEITLSQELFHAVQEHTFNVSNYTANTLELHNARDGIIEGDGNFVDYLYEQRCQEGWDCLMPQDHGGGGGGSGVDTHVGMLALRLQPYSDGPVFVQGIYEARGWSGVNQVYQQPPKSTEQTIHPDRYLEDPPTDVTIQDQSSSRWYVPDLGKGTIDYAAFGEAGLYVMLWYPSYVESQQSGARTTVVIPVTHFFNPRSASDLDLYNYSHPATAGWDGDRLLPYVTNRSAGTNETGYVWKIVWDSERDAMQFQEAYRALLEYHGAEPVQGRRSTYRIRSGPFADAFYVGTRANQTLIVNAPTVEALAAVRAGAAPRTPGS